MWQKHQGSWKLIHEIKQSENVVAYVPKKKETNSGDPFVDELRIAVLKRKPNDEPYVTESVGQNNTHGALSAQQLRYAQNIFK
jgi:hypothetical protein